MEIITDIEQGTEEWHNLRLGWITASRFKDVLAGGKGLTRKAYMLQLAAEMLTDMKDDSYSNGYMEWGTETEPQARAMYELDNAVEVEQVSFIRHSTMKVGCSPDGLVGDSGMIEIKCPKTTTHIETYLSGSVPTFHTPQIQGQLWVSEREWCDFISFDPRVQSEVKYLCIRVVRDDDYIKNILEPGISKFSEELFLLMEKLK